MKYGISACLAALAVIAMLVSACGGGGGDNTGFQTPQAVVFVSLSTVEKRLTEFDFKVNNGPGASTADFSAVWIGGATSGAFIPVGGISVYNPTTRVDTVVFQNTTSFNISTAPIVKIPYTWQSGANVTFRPYSAGASDNLGNTINNPVPIIRRVDYFDSKGNLVTP